MYLKSFEIENFRKFRGKNNRIELVDAKSIRVQREEKDINIAPTTTLIVGKNNSGKTTIIKALELLVSTGVSFKANDFNFHYLQEILQQYKQNFLSIDKEPDAVKPPYLKFSLHIGLEDDENDLITNLVPFMYLKDIDKSEIKIRIKYELADKETFEKNIDELFKDRGANTQRLFNDFLDLLNESDFILNYYDANDEVIKNNFQLRSLVELRSIKANNIENETSLTKAFSKIIEYRYKTLFEEKENDLEIKIQEINKDLSALIEEKHTNDINNSLEKIESTEKLKVLLSADLNFRKVMSNLIKYEYVEKKINVPENQYGLGYTKLMMIIADLIEYMEKYPKQSFNSMINIISIEEPETFMHPQMQELFIKNINEAIKSLLESKKKNVNSQLLITTHSSHILNSKIHSGNTFNNINYVAIKDDYSQVVNLNDDIVRPDTPSKLGRNNQDDLNFLKKHIKYKVSELFFSDAVIFVEGVTEETLIKYYIDQNTNLNKYYISIFNIDGAHGLVYHNLIKSLKVPALVITDLDIKRNEKEKSDFKQISDITEYETTNQTLCKYNSGIEKLRFLASEKIESENMYIAYQGKIEGFYATSFEEAYILTNYNNELLNKVLKVLKPKIYKGIVGENNDKNKIKEKSYKLQAKLSNDKSVFANELLYFFINDSNRPIPVIPKYIEDGLQWLAAMLKKE